jgi:hypothetical protein
MIKLTKENLEHYYINKKLSVFKISELFKCSQNKINYWLKHHNITKRSISEAIYVKANPKGDPFSIKDIVTIEQAMLYGIGLGLYWGEGTKSNKSSIRLGNTNPKLIKKFIEFLVTSYGIEKSKLRFGLQIFSEMDPIKALNFWKEELDIENPQFQKVIVTPSRGVGTYKHKIEHGVLTIYYNNKKLRNILCGALDNL